jgi:hypothetical protein
MLQNAAHGNNDTPVTRFEYEQLRVAGGDGPAENPGDGSNHAQLVQGIENRYHWTPAKVGPPGAPKVAWSVITTRMASVGAIGALQGSMGVWSRTSHWRRWDSQFSGPHDVFIERIDRTDRWWWMNPQAPNSYPGEFIPIAEAKRYYDGFVGGALFARVGQVATPRVKPWWAGNIAPDIKAAYRSVTVGAKLRTLGVKPGDAINYSDLEAGLRKRGINYGTSVQLIDVRALMRPGTN